MGIRNTGRKLDGVNLELQITPSKAGKSQRTNLIPEMTPTTDTALGQGVHPEHKRLGWTGGSRSARPEGSVRVL